MIRVLFAAFILFLVPSLSHARMIMPPTGANPASVFGQDHAYTVTFRGNGEAVVNLRVVLTNNEEATQSAVMLRVPRVQPQDVVAFQVIHEPQCIQWGPQAYDPVTRMYEPPQPPCIEYQEPDYHNYYYGNSTYTKAGVDVSGDTLTITLPEGIDPHSSASFLLYYRALGYTQKSAFGSYAYAFETVKTEEPINQLQVGITTDSDMVLKGAQSDVQYRFDDAVVMESSAAPDSKMGMSNPRFNTYYQQIGQGSIVKTASYLQPLDSFTVEGAYADSVWQLYGQQVVLGALVVVGTLLLLIYLMNRLMRVLKNRNHTMQSQTKALWVGAASFIASFIAACYTVFLFVLIRFLETGYYVDSDMNLLIVLLLLIVSLGVYPILLFGPGLLIGMKKGVWAGVGTFILTIVWLLVYLVLVFAFMALTRATNNPQPIPYMRGTESSPGIPAVDMME